MTDAAVTDNTPILLTVAGDTFRTTLGLLLADNDPDALDRDAIVAALARNEAYVTGGGAAPEVLIERAG